MALVLGAATSGCVGAVEPARMDVAVPAAVHVPLDLRQVRGGAGDFEVAERPLAHAGSVGFTLTVDTRDLRVGTLRAVSGSCTTRADAVRCTGTMPPDAGRSQRFRVTADPGAVPGATGVLRYALTRPHAPARSGRITVVLGRPVLRVERQPEHRGLAPGGTAAVPVVLRDIGESSRGVTVSLLYGSGTRPVERHRNCRYSVGGMECDFPQATLVSGGTYAFGTPEMLRVGPRATRTALVIEAQPYELSANSGTAPNAGNGAPVGLVPADATDRARPSTAFVRQAGVSLVTRNTADLAAVGATVRAPVGGRATVRVGVRNDGPGEPGEPDVAFDFHPPAGTTVAAAPYSAADEEEQAPQPCRALGPDGQPVAEAYERQPAARVYRCRAYVAHIGRPVLLAFTLRVDRAGPHPGGRVVLGAVADRPDDPATADDTAAVTVAPASGDPWFTRPGVLALAACLLAAAVAAAVLRAVVHGRAERDAG